MAGAPPITASLPGPMRRSADSPGLPIAAPPFSLNSALVSIFFLLRYLRTHTTHIFIYYRYALGLVLAVLLIGGWVK